MHFVISPYLKSILREQGFSDLNDLRYATKDIIQNLDKYWYKNLFYKRVNLHEKVYVTKSVNSERQ